ncbi:MAG: glycosyltransferase family 39 protein [Lachnospiraceae bacterium]|nr:glycosyltransferase family 39 protein [Lachnospiraceae bacterium]
MQNSSFEIKPFIYLVPVVFILCFCLDTTQETLKNPVYLFLFLSVMIIAGLQMGRLKDEETDVVYLIIAMGIFLKILYVLYTAIWTRQHDVIDFGVGEGHAGYIEYIYFNRSLPTGDPREKWAFFHPPLHHVISAVWMKIGNRLGLAYRQLQENIQALTLFYVSASSLVSYFICKELGLKKNGKIIAMLIISFHPVFVIMSGSINNDALSLFFMILSLYILILWYKEPKLTYITGLALCIGLSMFAKLSGVMVAPAAAVLFVLKLIKDRGNILRYIFQYIIFGLIVFPLGIGWEIKNMIRYGMPFNYIPPVGEQLVRTDLFSRLFDIRTTSIYPMLTINGDAFDEYNVWLSMFKTSIFDDVNMSLEWPVLNPSSFVMFTSGVVLAFVCFAAMIKVLVTVSGADKEGGLLFEWKLMLFVFYLTMMVLYLNFALGSSNYSAESFRYISAVIIVEALFVGIFADALAGSGEVLKVRKLKGIYVITGTFCVSSFVTYLLLGFAR